MLTIDEKILENAKNQIPNLSAFFEECLKQYMGYANESYPTSDMKKIMDEIGLLQVKAYLINQNYDAEKELMNKEKEEKNRAWRFLWNEYRQTLEINDDLMETAVDKLGVTEDKLEIILDEVHTDGFKEFNDWFKVYEEYGDRNE